MLLEMFIFLECGGRLRGPIGIIDLSNNTTHFNLDNTLCIWNVTVRPGRTISVKFLTMEFASQSACTYSYVLVRK